MHKSVSLNYEPPSEAVVDRLRIGWLNVFSFMVAVPREQRMLRGHLLRVIYHQVYAGIRRSAVVQFHPRFSRDWYFIAEQPAPAPHLTRPEGRAALTHMC